MDSDEEMMLAIQEAGVSLFEAWQRREVLWGRCPDVRGLAHLHERCTCPTCPTDQYAPAAVFRCAFTARWWVRERIEVRG